MQITEYLEDYLTHKHEQLKIELSTIAEGMTNTFLPT